MQAQCACFGSWIIERGISYHSNISLLSCLVCLCYHRILHSQPKTLLHHLFYGVASYMEFTSSCGVFSWKGNSEFCFPSVFSLARPRGTLRVEWNQNSLAPERPVIYNKCLVATADWKKYTEEGGKEGW